MFMQNVTFTLPRSSIKDKQFFWKKERKYVYLDANGWKKLYAFNAIIIKDDKV
jgi:hypothetical protein